MRRVPFAAQVALLYAAFLLLIVVLVSIFGMTLAQAAIGAGIVMFGPVLIVVGRREGIGR